MAEVDMWRRESTLRKINNGETRVVPMTPDVLDTFTALHRERRLDTSKVFLYKGKPWKNSRQPLLLPVVGRESPAYGCMIYGIPPVRT